MPKPYFVKVVLLSTIKEKRLRIPDTFLRKFQEELSQSATLHVQDGLVWRVAVRKADDKLWFHDGWKEFLEHYSIGIGYLLIFRYEGNSTFNVCIYNLTKSEISYHPRVRGLANGEQQYFPVGRYTPWNEMEDEDSSDALNTLMPHRAIPDLLKKKAVIVNGSCSVDQLSLSQGYPSALPTVFNGNMHPQAKNAVISHPHPGVRPTALFSGEVKLKREGDEADERALEEVKKPQKRGRKKLKVETSTLSEPTSSMQPDEDSEMRSKFYVNASTRKRTVTAEERERAVNAAKLFEPRNPFFQVVLRPSYLYRGCIMYLPSSFAEKHLNGVVGFIKLERADGQQWPVRCIYKGGRSKLTQGWFDFSSDNNLEEGDVCVFEIIPAREVILKVTIFRVADAVVASLHPR